jgi:hypothetical protein
VIIVPVAQRTPEWETARLGRLTGTGAADMVATLKKGGEAAPRRDLRLRLVCERLTGVSAENGYVNKDMQRGIDLEPIARAAYEAETGRLVRPVGFVAHDTLQAGCSPDGELKDYEGILEIKCPRSATQLAYYRAAMRAGGADGVPPEYLPQVIHNLWITGAAWCDFVSYDPLLPAPLRLLRVRVRRSEIDLAAYELTARMFLTEVERELADVQALIALATREEVCQ